MVVEGGILVTESTRSKLWNLLSFLGWWEAVIGITISVIVVRPTRTLSSHLPESHHNLLYVFYAELLVGVASAVVAVQGVIVSHASLHNPLLHSTTRAYNTWMVIGIALVISLIAVLFIVPAAIEGGRKEILEIMEGGVSYYLSDIEWKISLDKLHQEFQCCGINSISDWYKSRWIPVRSFRPEVADLREILLEDGTLGPRVVPASCCNPDVNQPCFHDALQQNASTGATLFPKTLFTQGCGELVVDPAVSTVGPFKVLAISALLLQAGQLVIGRYLYMEANRSSDEIRDEQGLKTRRKRRRICGGTVGTSCSSKYSGKMLTQCNNCTAKCESPKKSLRSDKKYVKSHPSKIGQAIKNFALPFGQPKSPRKYDVFCASVDGGSESPFFCSDDELLSNQKSMRWHSEEYGDTSSAKLIPLPNIETAASGVSEAETSATTPRLLENPNTKKNWWEPELDLLKLDL